MLIIQVSFQHRNALEQLAVSLDIFNELLIVLSILQNHKVHFGLSCCLLGFLASSVRRVSVFCMVCFLLRGVNDCAYDYLQTVIEIGLEDLVGLKVKDVMLECTRELCVFDFENDEGIIDAKKVFSNNILVALTFLDVLF